MGIGKIRDDFTDAHHHQCSEYMPLKEVLRKSVHLLEMTTLSSSLIMPVVASSI
jgi:hypothetical protein